MSEPRADILLGDCRGVLSRLPSCSVHVVITDPPYCLDGMGEDWDHKKLEGRASKAGVIGGMPVGMKFDANQGLKLQGLLSPVAEEVFRILKPGGFCICFSQARLYHRAALAFEESGFEIRDMLAWRYDGQAKAFSQEHFVRKKVEKGLLSKAKGAELIKELQGRKTPQLKPQLEPMCLAQKPKDGTFVDNWCEHHVGLVDVEQSLDGMFPGNCMAVPKPSREERGGNEHFTVKPVALIEHLIKLFTLPGQTVLDPFMGSGSHGVAAMNTGRGFIGIEVDPTYYKIATRRIKEL